MGIIDKLKLYITGASIAGAAYTPKTEYKGSLPKGIVKNGSRGFDVTAVQTFLNWGIGAGLIVDAIAGPKTVAAIKAFQKQSGIAVDGIFGSNTKTKAQALINNYKKKPTPPKKTYKVIDVSEFQDSINWSKAKADGVQGAIIRCGLRGAESGTLKTDSMFLNHIKGAYNAGIPVGIYIFTEAVNAKEGKEEAQYAIKLWKTAGVPISYPIGIDSEDVVWKDGKGRANHDVLSKAKRTEAIKAFAEECKRQGYKAMLYASTSWLNQYVDMSVLEPILDVWCAQYYSKCEYKGKYIMWQYTSSGKVNGARGNIDINHCYIEPKKINPPKDSVKKAYTGKFPEYRLVKTNAQVIADCIAWLKYIASNNNFHYGHGRHAHHNGCYFCGTQPTSKKNSGITDWKFTYCCNPFVHAGWAHGGCIPRALKMCREYGSWDMGTGSGSYHTSKLFTKLGRNESLKAGDVLCSDTHVALYIGGGKVIQAGHEDDNKKNSASWNSSISIGRWNGWSRAYRYNSSVNADMSIFYGEMSDRVALLWDFMNWYFNGALGESQRYYGDKIMGYTKRFQREQGLIDDGIVGPKTIAKMKVVKK